MLVILLLLIATPFLFQDKIKESVKTFLNDSVDAQVNFETVNLSLLSSFPNANVSVHSLKIINHKPFEGDTLAMIKLISFDMSIKELFKSTEEEPIVVSSIAIDEARINVTSDKLGNSNYNISKKTEDSTPKKDTINASFKFKIDKYSLSNSAISYRDEISKTVVNVSELNHSGKGTFSSEVSELNTTTAALVSLSIDSAKYLNNNSVKLEAILDLDLNENKYTFKDNKAFINQLALEFNGFFKLLDAGQEIDISFKNQSTTFRDFLAVLPEAYTQNLEDVKTTGSFTVEGWAKGLMTETSIPAMEVSIVSNNASFKYPELPKGVEAISINASVRNDSGNVDDTYINIKNLNFKIDQDVFKSSASIKNLSKNMMVDATIDGTLNLANITKAYPIELDNELSGILKGKLNTIFDRNALETNAYERIKNKGRLTITDFVFSSEDLVNPFNISKVAVEFKPGIVTLQSFAATTGKSDIAASGTINNLLGFLLRDKTLQENFKVNSNAFSVSDFMVERAVESTENTPTESLKIPAFLDCTLTADAKTVFYDNLTLQDVKGTVVIKDEKAILKNMSSRIFEGDLTLNGTVDTQPVTPTFDMELGIDRFNISQSFNDLELLQSLAPIANALQGKLNSNFKISGNLTNELSPDLNSLTGAVFGELLATKVTPKNAVVFDKLKGALTFVDFDKLNLNDLKTKLNFENGKVNVSPFNLAYEDIAIRVQGAHSFDKTMSYQAVFDVPAKYFGDEVNDLIAKINTDEANKLTIPVTASIGGSFLSPTVSTDLSSGVAHLTKQLIEIQKQKFINQGKDQIKDVLGGLFGGNKSKEDSTSTEAKNPVKDILGGFLGGKKK